MKRFWVVGVLALISAGIVLANAVFIVDQRKQVVVTRLGVPVRVINPAGGYGAGLQTKVPFVETVSVFDKRSQAVDGGQQEVVTSDKQRLAVDAVARYRISDPLAFLRALRDEGAARERLAARIAAAIRKTLGEASVADILSGRRSALAEKALSDLREGAAAANLGIEVETLEIRRVDLPPVSAELVYQRMISSLQQQAAQIRAQGEASKQGIIAEADKDAATTLAEANERASAVRGAGDAQAAQLYAAAYGKDPGFAAFYRTMRAYENALARKDTTLVLSPDSDFFRYFREGPKSH